MSNVKSSRPPPRELFFSPLEVVLDPNTLEMIQFAYIASKYGHRGQFRDDGTRFFDHPKGAAWIYIHELEGRDPAVIINTLLHDLEEDAYLLSPYRIAHNFGKERALDVRALTKLPKGKETTQEYLARVVNRGPNTIIAKLCDRLHNVRDLAHCTEEKRRRQLLETEQCHIPILIPALKMYGDPFVQVGKMLEGLFLEAMEQYQA